MKIQVYFQPGQSDEGLFKGKTVIVIDVLRASTTLCAAIYSGAKEIIPVATVDNAMKIATNLFSGQYLLGGERAGKMIAGFDLGNSPSEYSVEKVGKKSIVFATTNGTVAIHRTRYSDKTLIAGFVNLSAILEHFAKNPVSELHILCAGKENEFCIEDSLCAGALISGLKSQNPESEFSLSDAARASLMVWESKKINLEEELRNSDHGKVLIELGLDADIVDCATIDKYPVVPVLKDSSTLKAWTETTQVFKKVDL
ncbi:MAG: 2-phosphosulfolactate phosphatase [Bacteroidetes bacterium]|nr:2-phosphosulfolactate phosphatase [Bacteroidota bacterium]